MAVSEESPPYPRRWATRLLFRGNAVSPWTLLSSVALLVVGLVITFTARDYGITWDEENHKIYGDLIIRWYTSLFADDAAVNQWRFYVYGGFFDTIAEAAARLSPQGAYETRHAVNAVFGFLGLIAAYGAGRRLAGPAAGFFSAAFLAVTPIYYGQLFTNPKDIPFAALFMISLFFMLRCVDSLPNPRTLDLVGLAAAMGATMAVRIGGAVLLGYLAILWMAWLALQMVPNRSSLPSKLKEARSLALRFALVALAAWAIMLVWWPWAQVSPILHPLEALTSTASYDWPLTVFFKGANLEANNLPLSYLPTWFAITLPEFYFLAALAGCFLAVSWLRRRQWDSREHSGLLKIGLVAMAAFVPMATGMVLGTSLYDGIRQLTFVVPCLAVLAGSATAKVLASGIPRLPRWALALGVFLSMGLTVYDMVELHPYEYIFFNRSVAGGLESAASRFDTDYYGASYREGVQWLINSYRPDTTEKIRVANSSKDFLTGYYLSMGEETQRRFKPVSLSKDPHIYLSTTRWNRHLVDGKILHVVSRKGVPLLYVIELKSPS